MGDPVRAFSRQPLWLLLLAVPLLVLTGGDSPSGAPRSAPEAPPSRAENAGQIDSLRREVDRLRKRVSWAERRARTCENQITDLQEELRKQREHLEAFSQWSLNEMFALGARTAHGPPGPAALSSLLGPEAHSWPGTEGTTGAGTLASLLAAAATLPATSPAARAVLRGEIREVFLEEQRARRQRRVDRQLERRMARLTEELGLSATQAEQARPLVEEFVRGAMTEMQKLWTGTYSVKKYNARTDALIATTGTRLHPLLSAEQTRKLEKSSLWTLAWRPRGRPKTRAAGKKP